MPLLEGKKGLVMGVAHKSSIASHVAKMLLDQGAHVNVSFFSNGDVDSRYLQRIKKSTELGDRAGFYGCNVADEESLEGFLSASIKDLGGIDFIVHSIAYADSTELSSDVCDMSRKGFLDMMDISVYSLLAIARLARQDLAGGSLVTVSHYGAQKAIPGFNGMGIAKSALESSVRYLAKALGEKETRVNAVSPSPVRTLSSFGLQDYQIMKDAYETRSPLKEAVTHEDIAKSICYLVSDFSSGITGEVMHVDGGFHSTGL